jgi:hypothetical protein
MGQGELFALSAEQMATLLACRDSTHLQREIDLVAQSWPEENRLEMGKQWNLIHCCLSDGTCNPRGGSYPLNRCILGGRHLFAPEDGCMVVIVTPEEVQDVDMALASCDDDWFRQRYAELFAAEYKGPIPDWEWEELIWLFQAIKAFYKKAARERQAVLFVTDETLNSSTR